MNFVGAGVSASAGSGRYDVSIPGGGTGAVWQAADVTIYYDGANFYGRDEKTATQAYGPAASLHSVFNPAAIDLGTGTNFTGAGGLIVLSKPTNNVMTTTAPCVLQNQVTVFGPGRGLTVRAVGGANWSSGTVAAPKAVFMGDQVSRVRIEGVRIDCAGIAGTSGILF